MGDKTEISWADSTFNPWEGCQKVGPGCDHCYAETRNARFGGGQAPNWGPGAPRRRTSEANWRKPLQWQANASEFMAKHGRRQRVFCASLADVFDNAVPHAWRVDLFELIEKTPDLDWLLLTKRIGNVRSMLPVTWSDGQPNVWIGATITSQEEADRDIPKLLAVPARVRFLSMEPLLGPVDLSFIEINGESEIYPLRGTTGCVDEEGDPAPDLPALDWVIVGGESGPGARPMHPDWARFLRDQCAAAGVPFLFKQWGEWGPDWEGAETCSHCGKTKFDAINERGECGNCGAEDWQPAARPREGLCRVGKKAAGRLLDGAQHDGFPGTAT